MTSPVVHSDQTYASWRYNFENRMSIILTVTGEGNQLCFDADTWQKIVEFHKKIFQSNLKDDALNSKPWKFQLSIEKEDTSKNDSPLMGKVFLYVGGSLQTQVINSKDFTQIATYIAENFKPHAYFLQKDTLPIGGDNAIPRTVPNPTNPPNSTPPNNAIAPNKGNIIAQIPESQASAPYAHAGCTAYAGKWLEKRLNQKPNEKIDLQQILQEGTTCYTQTVQEINNFYQDDIQNAQETLNLFSRYDQQPSALQAQRIATLRTNNNRTPEEDLELQYLSANDQDRESLKNDQQQKIDTDSFAIQHPNGYLAWPEVFLFGGLNNHLISDSYFTSSIPSQPSQFKPIQDIADPALSGDKRLSDPKQYALSLIDKLKEEYLTSKSIVGALLTVHSSSYSFVIKKENDSSYKIEFFNSHPNNNSGASVIEFDNMENFVNFLVTDLRVAASANCGLYPVQSENEQDYFEPEEDPSLPPAPNQP